MKKKILCLSILFLVGCNKLIDDTPKCNDDDVVELVQDMSKIKNSYPFNIEYEVYEKFYGKRFPTNNNDPELEEATKNYKSMVGLIEQYIYNKDEAGIPVDLLEIIRNVCSEHNIIRGEYFQPTVSNIRIVSTDKETKSCSCEGDLGFQDNIKPSKSVFYTAQKNMDGETYVEVLK